jgi:hypothetical protein
MWIWPFRPSCADAGKMHVISKTAKTVKPAAVQAVIFVKRVNFMFASYLQFRKRGAGGVTDRPIFLC